MSAYVDAADLSVVEPHDDTLIDYPTPEASEAASTETEAPRKKRKAWGQPVPEIVPILPPRKRAKTAEEKEQRKNERILRNRRAADKSRQRQKAAVADLEQRQKDIETENAQLKRLLAQYQSQFGTIPGCDFEPKISTPTVNQSLSIPTPLSLNDNAPLHLDDQSTSTPMLTMDTPSTSIYQGSPSLTPTLSLGEFGLYPSSVSVSGMTQYPAEILCDLQCQPDTLTSRLRYMQPSRQLYEVLTLIHCLITWQTSLEKTLSLMSLAFQHLTSILSATSTQLDYLVQANFHLIHILISMPATTTQPAVFRLKLLSRLLACNPNLALLLEKAADQALQQKVSQENWMDDADARWAWSSLMTIKWSIQSLERQHAMIRAGVRAGTFDKNQWTHTKGVDYEAVEFTADLWDGSDFESICTSITTTTPTTTTTSTSALSDADSCLMTSTEVH